MAEYDSGPRYLTWPLLHPLVGSRTVEDDPAFGPSSFVWPDDPDERTLVPFWLSYNEWKILGSAIDVGSDPAFGEDALRVLWLWLRNMRVNVPICDAIIACVNGNPPTIAAIINQLSLSPVFNTYITNLIETVAPGGGGNIYPPRPTSGTPDALCNAATFVVSKIRKLIVGIYDDLETLTPTEVFESILGLLGWRSSPLYQLIGLLETADRTALLTAFDAAAPDLICELIAAQLDQTPILAWIAETYPPPSVLGDAMTLAVQSAADEGRYAQWIAVGATITTAECDCDLGWCYRIDFKTTNGAAQGVALTVTAPGIPEFSGSQWELGVGLKNVDAGNRDRAFASLIRPDVTITKARMEWEYEDPSGAGNVWMDNDFGTLTAVSYPQVAIEKEYPAGQAVPNYIFGGERSGSDFTPFIIITSLTLWGNGENPFGSSNC